MPELPEVETIKSDLRKTIKNKIIEDINVIWKGVLRNSTRNSTNLIKGTKVEDISRRAKLLIISLYGNYSILIHLKMTGQLIYSSRLLKKEVNKTLKDSIYKYARIFFFFSDSSGIIFNDQRKFGFVKIMSKEKMKEAINKENYGPEPLDKGFTLELFREILQRRSRIKIKQLLMDQKAIAGIGNIYSDEICFYARVLPVRKAGSLTPNESESIYSGINKILARAIELRGSSVENYIDAFGGKGDYVKELKVYGREGEKCGICGGIVERIKLGGRSSYYCPKCQK